MIKGFDGAIEAIDDSKAGALGWGAGAEQGWGAGCGQDIGFGHGAGWGGGAHAEQAHETGAGGAGIATFCMQLHGFEHEQPWAKVCE